MVTGFEVPEPDELVDPDPEPVDDPEPDELVDPEPELELVDPEPDELVDPDPEPVDDPEPDVLLEPPDALPPVDVLPLPVPSEPGWVVCDEPLLDPPPCPPVCPVDVVVPVDDPPETPEVDSDVPDPGAPTAAVKVGPDDRAPAGAPVTADPGTELLEDDATLPPTPDAAAVGGLLGLLETPEPSWPWMALFPAAWMAVVPEPCIV